jgi:hypothetical protein
LQPGQAFQLIGAQLQGKTLGWAHRLDAGGIFEFVGELDYGVHALELPALHPGQFADARHIIAGQADFAVHSAIE